MTPLARALALAVVAVPILRADVTFLASYADVCTFPGRMDGLPAGPIYVADPMTNQIVEFGSDGTVNASYVIPETPVGVGVHGADGKVFVSRGDGVVGIYDQAFNLLGTCDPSPFTFVAPTDIAVHPTTGEVYVVDTGANRVLVFDANGALLRAWGTQGTGLAEFENPQAIAIDADRGHVIVGDVDNFRIQVFDVNGVLQYRFGYRTLYTPSQQVTWVARMEGLAEDQCGNIYLADALMGTIRIFSPTGTELDPDFVPAVSYGSGPGQLRVPCDLLMLGDQLFVADTNNGTIDVFEATCTKLSVGNGLSPLGGQAQSGAGRRKERWLQHSAA